jgi:hypothetical protein
MIGTLTGKTMLYHIYNLIVGVLAFNTFFLLVLYRPIVSHATNVAS